MTKESLLMQYQSECRNALESVVNISKSFQKVFMDAMKLFMAIPNRINFLQMGRYGCFSEQTYRNNFENDDFDWFSFNEAIIREHLKGGRKAIAVDPSFIPKSGSKTPWIGYFWSGCASEYKRGLEITGIGVIDVDNHECMTLGSVQTPDNATLESYGKNLVDWYSSYLISIQEHLKRISGTVVCDAFFSKATFIKPLCENGFHVISRFRNDAVLFYPTLENRTGKRGRPKLYDGKIDFENLDITRCTEYKVNKGKLYGLKAYSKALKRFVSLAVWYPMDGRTDKWQLYFSTDEMQDAKEVLDFYRTRFQLEFCFRDAKQHAGMTNCQATDFRKLAFHFNASLAAINLAKAACKKMGIKYSISSCKSVIHNAYMLERFICVSGIEPNTQLIDKLFKELILFTAKAGSVEISWGLFFILVKYCLLRIMKNDYLNMLASLVLPAQILDYFLISGVEQTSQEIHISLDEKMNSKLSNDEHFESKGFMEAVNVTDFPIRDHKVILKIRRRRWTDLRTGKSFSIPIDLDVVAKGTRYSKEFGAFLKETYGDIPSDLPYA
ncbi:hypothetical protein BACCOP_04231 [Phocaeicola coprocola DSM 17136]|uniref:Transposase IS4-like domain-containing protein n=4 Tax=Phocaeicola TaxID=909656 RepID=B3JQJ5_9BACT|nr:hypothetical protein BACCOP_04231 [Phocaeicola coprocola DSM 17136]